VLPEALKRKGGAAAGYGPGGVILAIATGLRPLGVYARRLAVRNPWLVMVAIFLVSGCQSPSEGQTVSWTYTKDEARSALEFSRRLERQTASKANLELASLMSAAYWTCEGMGSCQVVRIDGYVTNRGNLEQIAISYFDTPDGDEVHKNLDFAEKSIPVKLVERVSPVRQ
jgi:hypothetical protein